MSIRFIRFGIKCCIILSLLSGCDNKPQGNSNSTPHSGGDKKSYKIALIAKSQGNQVFQAARVGAEDAAKDLSAKLGVQITIDWRTPNEEDAQKQAETIEQLAVQGVDGIAISCSDASTVTFAIDKAVDRGTQVMCFDSDAPASKRLCFFGVDDVQCGRRVLRETAKLLGDKGGKVAILAGNQTAPNLQARVRGVREEAAKYPNIKIVDVYYHAETPQEATAKVEEVQTVQPDIAAWAMVGGWPLFTDSLLKWEPGKVKIVAVDALPEQLQYVRKGIAEVLLAQQVYDWGYKSVEILMDKIHGKKDPPSKMVMSELTPVTKENVEAFAKNWEKWLRK
ncbi:MAG: substrate-binding domain-containing protein [Planctomycetes bacterium]|nr:substrate-binding domain-containing protein [Planctomycetota bacterium]